ncbi:low density lipoprotein receptor adapter protein 1 [Tribolium castaneum]|uniref:low density lipoprotein receptor adapter protein 1 n=1 Tax=Tribolium castaneum TaxID=7070 RepID=UPI0030FEDFDF
MAFLKSIWKNNGKHQKLSEELALQNAKEAENDQTEIENENDVITFKLKYLGSTVVEKLVGDSINTEAVKNIIKVTKASRKKLQRVNIAISLKGIAVTDLEGNDILKISIYRISNCSTDPTHRQVFSFVSTDAHETMECHAFICSKRKMAETVTLAVAHAFSTAYEAWRILPTTKEFEKNVTTKENQQNRTNTVEEKLIDFGDEDQSEFATPTCQGTMNSHWVCFDDDFSEARNGFKTDLIVA